MSWEQSCQLWAVSSLQVLRRGLSGQWPGGALRALSLRTPPAGLWSRVPAGILKNQKPQSQITEWHFLLLKPSNPGPGGTHLPSQHSRSWEKKSVKSDSSPTRRAYRAGLPVQSVMTGEVAQRLNACFSVFSALGSVLGITSMGS